MPESGTSPGLELLQTRRLQRAIAAATGLIALAGCSSHTSSESPAPERSHSTAPSSAPSNGPRGYDVSYPQGDGPFPSDAAFGIVAVNGRLATEFNPYLRQQVQWAAGLKGLQAVPAVAYYVHVSNAGAKQSSSWPSSGSNRYGECRGDDSLACDYEQGAAYAKADLEHIQEVHPGGQPMTTYLDVEPEYSWQKDTRRNQATIEGMAEYFQNNGVEVGIYSSPDIWRQLVGTTESDSPLHGLRVWQMGIGAHNEAEAKQLCDTTAFTAGRIVMVQVAAENSGEQFDADYVC